MELYILEQTEDEAKFHAGSKARVDLEYIFEELQYTPLIVSPTNAILGNAFLGNTIYRNLNNYRVWEKAISQLNKGDILYLQYPVINYSFLLDRVIKKARTRGVSIVAFVHDLWCLRDSLLEHSSSDRNQKKIMVEHSILTSCSKIVVHNEKMKQYCMEKMGIGENKMITLELFDYLIPQGQVERLRVQTLEDYKKVIVAGNLNREKSGYVYELPQNVEFELYGVNYEDQDNPPKNVHYHGAFPPEELPFALKGGFGLVWDGTSARSCVGIHGNYLRYNNPHKASLYLASGIPIIIWKEAALADLVTTHGCGIVVESLDEIAECLTGTTPEDYEQLQKNASLMSEHLLNGHHTKKVCDILRKEYEN